MQPCQKLTNHRKAAAASPPHSLPWRVRGNHVYPADDLRNHSLTNCWCRPTDDDGIMVHNSLDGRELYEGGERKPS
jgi:hypothetical protein